MSKRKRVWPSRMLAVSITAVVLFPVIYIILISFKSGQSFYTSSIFPKEFTFDNYVNLLKTTDFLIWIKNSLVLAFSAAAITSLIAMFGGYSFSRFRFPGKKYGIMFLLIIQMLPTSVAMVAYFKMLQAVSLLDSLLGIILIMGFSNAAFSVWLMKNYMQSIPKEMDESARIDGASYWTTFWRIIFPLITPMLVAQFILSFIGVYNEFMFSALMLFSPDKYPLGLGIKSFMAGNYSTNWTIFCAASVLGSIPIMIIFYTLQRFLVSGLTKGAIKG